MTEQEANRQQEKIYSARRRRLKRKKRKLIIRLSLYLLLAGTVCFLVTKAAGLLFAPNDRNADSETVLPPEDKQVSTPADKSADEISMGYIVLDAGHGGEDSPGCVYDDILERDVTLELSFMIRDELVQRGYTVMMTREEDKEVTLAERAQLANNSGADLFISIHLNSHKNTSVHGIETWFNPDTNIQSSTLAEYVQQSISTSTEARDRGIYSDTSLVLTREVLIPSCLVEVGYLSNKEERGKMTSEAYRKKIAQGIANGVEQYLEEFPRSQASQAQINGRADIPFRAQ